MTANEWNISVRPWTLDQMIVDEVLSEIYTKGVPLYDNDVVVDAGAHIGTFTLYASQFASKVYAFEPHPENFEYLTKNVKDNDVKNVELINVAVLDYDGEAKFPMAFSFGNTGGSHVSDAGELIVRSVKLDTVVPKADFLKIDVEGAEMKVLAGAQRLLKSGPKIAMEVHSGMNLTEVERTLKGYGYKVKHERTFNLLNHMVWAWI